MSGLSNKSENCNDCPTRNLVEVYIDDETGEFEVAVSNNLFESSVDDKGLLHKKKIVEVIL